MRKIRKIVATILLPFMVILNFPSIAFAEEAEADTKITHTPVEKTMSGVRIQLATEVNDSSGVDVVRTYFKTLEAQDYVFIDMVKPEGNKEYQGVLPAPAKGVQGIDYLILVKNSANQVVKSQTFRIEVEDSDQAVAATDQIQVYTELAELPTEVTGFADNIALDMVESAAKFGVVAGLYSPSSAGGAGVGGAAAGGGAVSAGTVAATAAGIGTLGMIGIAAVAVGGVAAASSSSSDSGSDDGLQGGTGDVRVNVGWNNCADVDLHVTDPCGNEISFRNRTATCQDFTGRLDVDANASSCSNNPQENIVWADGAPRGSYLVSIEQFNDKGISSTSVRWTSKAGENTDSGSVTLGNTGDSHTFTFQY